MMTFVGFSAVFFACFFATSVGFIFVAVAIFVAFAIFVLVVFFVL